MKPHGDRPGGQAHVALGMYDPRIGRRCSVALEARQRLRYFWRSELFGGSHRYREEITGFDALALIARFVTQASMHAHLFVALNLVAEFRRG
jgi:hypothetical protein